MKSASALPVILGKADADVYTLSLRRISCTFSSALLNKIEKFQKNKHIHIFDIGVYAYLRALFFWEFRRVWAGKRRLRKRILGQPPSAADIGTCGTGCNTDSL